MNEQHVALVRRLHAKLDQVSKSHLNQMCCNRMHEQQRLSQPFVQMVHQLEVEQRILRKLRLRQNDHQLAQHVGHLQDLVKLVNLERTMLFLHDARYQQRNQRNQQEVPLLHR